MKAFFLFLTLLMLNCVLTGQNAHAAEKLRFDSPIPRSSFEKIKSFSRSDLKKNIDLFQIAAADLNRDGLEEYIIRAKDCGKNGLCDFTVLAETREGIFQLGSFTGQNLLLGNEYTQGVRNILIFDNRMNDFDYELYTWHPETSSYGKERP